MSKRQEKMRFGMIQQKWPPVSRMWNAGPVLKKETGMIGIEAQGEGIRQHFFQICIKLNSHVHVYSAL